jgi:hypothetical protein
MNYDTAIHFSSDDTNMKMMFKNKILETFIAKLDNF